MYKKILAMAILLSVIVAFGMHLGKLYSQEEVSTKDLSSKLDTVLQNQDRILAALDEVKRELEVVKIRASRR